MLEGFFFDSTFILNDVFTYALKVTGLAAPTLALNFSFLRGEGPG